VKDIHLAITERFINQLRAGSVPWQRPWQGVMNIASRKNYRGINSLTLGLSKFASPFWMTFRQAHELGGHIRKGEKSAPIIYYKFLEKRDPSGNAVFTAKGKAATVPFLRWSNVFNLEQTEGVEAPELTAPPVNARPLGRAEELVRQTNLCPIRKEGFAAAYSPHEDIIHMPPTGLFRSPEDYYHTLFHEMTHATGHASRLDREGITNPIKFGSDRYSKEELIAELGAAFLSNDAGILDQVRFENSTAYLGSWISKFESEPTLLISAASHAQRSFNWVAGTSHEESESIGEDQKLASAETPTPLPGFSDGAAPAILHEPNANPPPLADRSEQPSFRAKQHLRARHRSTW
jgi:antirestriction protein ArdC